MWRRFVEASGGGRVGAGGAARGVARGKPRGGVDGGVRYYRRLPGPLVSENFAHHHNPRLALRFEFGFQLRRIARKDEAEADAPLLAERRMVELVRLHEPLRIAASRQDRKSTRLNSSH